MGSGLWVSPSELDSSWGSDPGAIEALSLASHVLWSFSGRKYGRVRTITETYECPCGHSSCAFPASKWNTFPTFDGGAVLNAKAGNCGCKSGVSRLRLRGTPIRRVQEVRTSSGVLDPDSYRVENSGLLTLDPGGPGSTCGLQVTYSYGTGIPGGGRVAAKLLAQELLKSWSGDEECRLPDRVTNVSREGVSFTIMDKQEFLDDLRTGIYEVDLFLRAVNPDRARKKARVFSPDLAKAYRTTAGPTYVPTYPLPGGQYTLRLVEGAMLLREFTRTVDGSLIDFTTMGWASQIREDDLETAELILDLAPYLAPATDDPTVLVLNVPASVIDALEPFPNTAAWDLFVWPLDDPEAADKLIGGPATFDTSATQKDG